MSSPAKTESLGWFTRIFRGSVQSVTDGASHSGTSSKSPAPISSPVDSPATIKKRVADARNLLKDLSPANGSGPSESTTTGKGLRSLASPISTQKTTVSEVQKRKRLHVEEPKEQLPVEDIFATTTAKRFCGNMSLIEEPIAISVPERLDATWGGEVGFGINASPASSVRSLKSRLSGAASTTSSGLSSRTRAILNQLEKVHTPAKEARRLPLMRSTGIISERWNHANAVLNSPGAPPLRKAKTTATPTRLQLLSTNLGFNKKPYWKDIYRKPAEQNNEAERHVPASADRTDLNGSLLAPIFDVPETPKTKNAVVEPERRVSKIKGTDGKSRNVFNTKDLEEDEIINHIPIPMAVPLKITAPTQGFLDGLNFKFDLPKERTSFGAAKGKVTPEPKEQEPVASSDGESDDSEVESEDSESNESEPEVETPPKKTPKPVLETKKSITPPPVKVAAPVKTSAEAKWSCTECFVESTGDKCVCCGAAKGGGSSAPAPKKDLISNINTFAAKPTTGSFSFGFGGAAKPAVAPAPEAAKHGFGKKSEGGTASAPLFAAPKKDAPAEEKKSDGERVDWDCPDCCVSNKASQDSCACCGHVKYKTAGASSSVFGANAFKPTTSNSGISFGLSASGSAPAPTSNFSFGLGASKPVEPTKADTVKADTSSASTTTPAFAAVSSTSTVPLITVSDTSKPATTVPSFGTGSLFGNSAPKFNGFAKDAAPSASIATTSASTSAGASLFGTSKPVDTPASSSAAPATAPLGGLFAPAPTPSSSTSSLFSGSSTSVVGSSGSTTSVIGASGSTTSLFGTSAKPASSTEPTGNLFSAITANSTAATSSAPLTLFGKTKENGVAATATTTAPAAAAPVFSFGASTSTAPSLFGDKPAEKPLFPGSQEKPLFGTTTAAPAPAFTGFSASSSTPAVPAPTFGNLSQSSSALFGTPKVDDAPAVKKGMFSFGATGETPAPAPASAFSQSSGNLFGNSAPAAPPLFGSQPSGSSSLFATPAPAAAPTLSASSSTSSLFSGSTEPPTSFNFGAAAAPAGNQPFFFGNAVPQPSGGISFGAQPAAPTAPGGAFAYSAASSAGARKIATARRRMPGRK